MNLYKKIKIKKRTYMKNICKIYYEIQKKIICDVKIHIKYNLGKIFKIKNNQTESIEYLDQEIIKIIIYKNHQISTIYLNNFNKDTIHKSINFMINNITFSKYDKYYILGLYKNNKNKKSTDLGLIFYNENISNDDLIEVMKNIEQNSLNVNKKLLINENVIFKKTLTGNILSINNNIFKDYYSNKFSLVNNVIAQDKKKKNMEYYCEYINTHKLFDLITKSYFLGKKTAQKAISKLYSKKIKTKKYLVLFNQTTSAKIFSYLAKSLNGYYIYNNISFMKKKLNKQILPKWFNIIEDPFIYKGIGSKPFDNDGFDTKKYTIIKKGILKTWITDFYYAKKLHINNTVNSGGIHNWIFLTKKKKINLKVAINKIKHGLIIEEIIGEGFNIETGYYSLGVTGYKIKNKKISHSINNITISGNLKFLLKNIIFMCDNININSKIRTGSICVPNIQIASEI